MRRFAHLALLSLLPVAASTLVGCLSDDDDSASSGDDAGTTTTTGDSSTTTTTGDSSTGDGSTTGPDPSTAADADEATKYLTYRDDLSKHPGCSTAGLWYTPAVLDGYTCAAKEYGTDDGSKSITIYVHGNSSSPLDWEKCPPNKGAGTVVAGAAASCTDTTDLMISDQMTAAGYHGYAVDVRTDLVTDDPKVNVAKNFDHGWAVPIVESLFEAVVAKYPTRSINMIGFSVGTTVIRDALRRLHRAGKNPYQHIGQLYLASGANHGVKTYEAACAGGFDASNNLTTGAAGGNMAILAACQLGSLQDYMPTPFLSPLNNAAGDDTSFDAPCSDGNTAYGQSGECGGHTVTYTTAVFKDDADGTTKDEFVDEASAHLAGATNNTVTETDDTGYFYPMNFIHHFGSIRSADGIALAVAVLKK